MPDAGRHSSSAHRYQTTVSRRNANRSRILADSLTPRGPDRYRGATMREDARRADAPGGAPWLLAGLVLIPLAAYARVAGFEFVNYDDPEYVVQNPMVRAGL